jgi:hypothetical protein
MTYADEIHICRGREFQRHMTGPQVTAKSDPPESPRSLETKKCQHQTPYLL